ncbi:MAG TPA: ABC transporter ATP-binding protein [Oscillospiraceae bacterium]|nr:ABC transporter ATP-binding protein [Oscillospiraceae bacterium]
MKTLSVKFDLGNDGALCDGTLALENDNFIVSYEGGGSFSVPFNGVKEARQFTDIGCGRLELVYENAPDDGSENVLLCRFSMSCVVQIGEFSKVVNYYIKSGELLEISDIERLVCPICGRHLIEGIGVCLFCVKKGYVFSRAMSFFKKYLPFVVFSGVLMMLSNFLSAIMPLFNQKLLDNYIAPAPDAAAYFDSPVKGIAVLAVLMGAAFAAGRVLGIFSARISNRIGSKFSNDLRIMVYDKIQRQSLCSVSKNTTGNLIKRITRDTEVVKDFFNQQGRYLISQIVILLVSLFMLFKTNAFLAALVIIPVPLGFFAIKSFWARIRIRYHKQWRADSRATSILHDIIKGIRVVKAFGNEESEIDKFSDASKNLANIASSNEKFWALTFPLVGNFITIGEFFILFFGGKMVIEGKLSVGELVMFNTYLAFLYKPLRWMSTLPKRIADASTSLVKLYEVLDEDFSIKDAEHPKLLNAGGAVEFKDVEFGYKSYEPVLRDISLKINPGEMIGLVGHSGAGKSTLINLCMRLYDPSLGSITIDGTDIRDIEQEELRNNIGVVFQETYLFSGTIYDNIAYARPGASPEEVLTAAKAANAHDFVMNLPDGYNTTVGENGHSLSGGERQRVAIARALLKNPKILILDEATSSLDPETESKIQEAISRLIENRTTIAIAHRLSTLRNANRLIVIEKGRIAEVGTHKELLKKKGIYYDLVMAQRKTSKLK